LTKTKTLTANSLELLVEKISDSYLAAGIDDFQAARKIYNYVKAAFRIFNGASGFLYGVRVRCL
jgi:hypothetical protein